MDPGAGHQHPQVLRGTGQVDKLAAKLLVQISNGCVRITGELTCGKDMTYHERTGQVDKAAPKGWYK